MLLALGHQTNWKAFPGPIPFDVQDDVHWPSEIPIPGNASPPPSLLRSSDNRGLVLGTQRQNDLKFEVLAEGERRLYQEIQFQKKELEEQKKSKSDIERQLNEALRKIEELKRRE